MYVMQSNAMDTSDEDGIIDVDFLIYSVLYSTITVLFAMAVVSKFLMNEIRLGLRSALSLAMLFIGEPLCHFLLKGPGGVMLFGFSCFLVYQILPASHLPVENKAVFITGCDSGFGLSLAKTLDGIGMRVFAGCLCNDGPGAIALKNATSDNLKIVKLDVTSQSDVDKAVEFVTGSLGEEKLWGLVNNAGTWAIGDVEMTAVETYHRLFEINVLGMIRVTKAFLPQIRASRGRVVSVTSLVGKIPMHLMSAYSMTKHAMEGYCDVLRMDMVKWGVNVSIVQPSGYQTEAVVESRIEQERLNTWKLMDEETRKTYGESYHKFIFDTYVNMRSTLSKDISQVVRAMRSGLLSKRPREKYPCGAGAETLLTVLPVLPVWLSDKIIRVISPFSEGMPDALKVKSES